MTAASNPLTLFQRYRENINSLPLLQALCNQFQSKESGQSLSNSGHPEPANKSKGRYAARALLSEQTSKKEVVNITVGTNKSKRLMLLDFSIF